MQVSFLKALILKTGGRLANARFEIRSTNEVNQKRLIRIQPRSDLNRARITFKIYEVQKILSVNRAEIDCRLTEYSSKHKNPFVKYSGSDEDRE